MSSLSERARIARFTEIHDAHTPALHRYLTRLTRSPGLAQDLVQETMARAWRHLDSLPDDPDMVARWLFTVARHVAVHSIRTRRARPPATDSENVK